ncbi:acyl transferase domain-containing protein [Shimia isoporae]|uniref:Phenolphthiocerol/phthiocerol polyketide synthase subunit E n=1 Tax=Shimia isoporae TaxID=647720 RepID=A0A4V2Q242_9RHOB|nr:type I polyketide synthase [Shimia isoporae]TCL00724.1 acyl transferase domain-containing protein [Shimia isoporae]
MALLEAGSNVTDQADARVSETDIAIVGMAAHLPGATGIDQYWQNLRDGIRSITKLSDEELLANGESLAKLKHRNYVPAAAMLDGFAEFDADFFGLSPKEAAIMDPQHRQFLEVSWEALENAGHMPENFDGPIGVFAGCGMGSYFYFNICSNRDLVDSTGMFLLRHTGNDKDFLATRLSHFLDLKGPSLGLQTACSTSLVAVHYAAQSILNGECDMALAGGVTIELPHGRGYVFEDGEILSPDGECHAFDHRAQGTVFGSGAGVVVLRRLEDAIADGDHIWAVIKGSAVNNDGSDKAGYLAPSVGGQASAVADALAIADISAETVDYVECHGTGTYLGDPIEIAALTEAFRETTEETGFCRIGSVKTNIGHLDTAAGAASLIKTSLALHHKQMPPSLGFEKPNPAIDFGSSPFAVNAGLRDWAPRNGPRRAGVNSLGVGGTNAHVIVDEAPARAPSQESDWPFHLIALSGRNNKALEANAANLAAHLRANPDQPLADISHTLLNGRRKFEKRRVLVAESHAEAADLLESGNLLRVFNHSAEAETPDVVFMFPGGGAQFVGMGRDLYETEPVFAEWMDRGFDVLAGKGGEGLRALWLAEGTQTPEAEEALKKPSLQLPLIMMVEYALAQLWISWGVTPAALVGHSMGENTAACLAGVMSFEDCLGLVQLRGRLFDTVPAGGMLSVPLPLGDVEKRLDDNLDIASVNAPSLTVVSGPDAALDKLAKDLAAEEVDTQRVAIDIAAHSYMLEPILEQFGEYLHAIDLHAPKLPIISNRTGAALLESEATDPDYWVAHLRNTVLFADDVTTLSQTPSRVFLEVGPGKALSSLVKMHGAVKADKVLSSLRHPEDTIADDAYFLATLGRLWACGVEVDFEQYWGGVPRQKVVLPSYAFQRSRYFIEPGKDQIDSPDDMLMRLENTADWTYAPRWRPRLADCDFDVATELADAPKHHWLIFTDSGGTGTALTEQLRKAGHDVVTVRAGDAFAQAGPDAYVLAPERGREGYDALIADLMARGRVPDRIVHMWLLTEDEYHRPGSSFFHRNQEQGFMSLFFLAQAITDENLPRPLHVTAISSGAVQVRDEAVPYPEKATALGAVQVMPRELPDVSASLVDVTPPARKGHLSLAMRLLEDLMSEPRSTLAAWRGEKRFERGYRRTELKADDLPVWKEGGTYLITGGFGGIGLTLAERAIREAKANIVLLSRDGLPDRDSWAAYLRGHASHDRIAGRIRAIERLESLGGRVLCLAADVCNIDEMREAVDAATTAFGPINGVVHAAGVIDDAPLLAKTSAQIDDVLAPKLHGTQVLEQVFPDGSIDWLTLFSSSSTATAPIGQIDYVAANAYLNAYAQSRAADRTRVRAINWGIWAEVGMAAEAVAARQGEADPAPAEPITAPLLDTAGFDGAGHRIFEATYDTSRWVLDEHRTKDGTAILPGTGYAELAAEAMRAHGEAGGFTLRDLLFLRPLQVAESESVGLRARLERSDEGYRFEVQSACMFEGREGWQTHAEARLIPHTGKRATLDVASLQGRFGSVTAATDAPLSAPQEAHLNFGPRWKVLRSMALDQNEGIATLSLDAKFADDGCLLPPGLLDIATGWAMDLIPGYAQTNLWVPVSYGALIMHAPLPAEIVSHVRLVSGSSSDGVASFDVALATPEGAICVEVEGLSIRQLEGAAFTAPPPLTAAEVSFDKSGQTTQPLSVAEERLAHNLSQGIMPPQGAKMFEAALRGPLPQVVISSLDLHALIAQADAGIPAASGDGQAFERPELDTDFVEPTNDIERTLAGFWQDLLGVDKVGIRDSFFDLGGHSLIAVRLFAMVKKAYRIEFPISVLFEAPTIETCAAMIAERLGGDVSTAEVAAATPDGVSEPEAGLRPRSRFTHLVPMHTGEGGARRPFFLVAGMFGNVLNLRHLAHLIGSDRPFYGLQARGLLGDTAPHDDLVEAARDYIAEMRQVQPHGPYLMGGFSGGGITAYEIRRQLEEAGEEVALVAMLDTPLPQRRALSRSDRMKIQMQELKAKGVAYPLIWAKNRIAWELSKRRAPEETAHDAQGQQFHDAEIEAAFLRAVASYEVAPWSGNLVLFRPPLTGKWDMGEGRLVDSDRAYVFHDNDWGQYVPHVQVFEVPGDHDSMVLEPNVRVLATRMKKVISAAEAAIAESQKEAAE